MVLAASLVALIITVIAGLSLKVAQLLAVKIHLT